MSKISKLFSIVMLLAVVFIGLQDAVAQGMGGSITATYTLPATPLKAIEPGIQNDRGVLLGGIGSDLWRSATDKPNEAWMITDRGPNGQIKVDDKNRRTFIVPDFNPVILHVAFEGDAIKVLETLPILTAKGEPVTGLSNLDKYDEKPWDFEAKGELAYNQNGLDTEGLVRTSAGEFWIADEYSPSIARIDATGKLIKRYVPAGLAYAADESIVASLPAIYGKRKGNRGFEGLAISPDEKTLYVALQSPLSNPDAKIGNASRTTRILAFDIATEKPVAEYAYFFDEAKEFGGPDNVPAEMKISGVLMVDATNMIVLERTDKVAKLYMVDISKADNILGTAWGDVATTPALESFADLAEAKVAPLPKTLIIDLSKVGVPDKIEGIALLDDSTLLIANDNDFALSGEFDDKGNSIDNGVKSQVLTIKLEKPVR